MCLLAICMSSLKKCLCMYSAHFSWLFVFYFELYKLFIYFGYQPLISSIIANIFSHLVGGLFILLIVSFADQKLFSLT